MDPVAHTLIGATLAETGLKRRSRYATATLLIGANRPDIDVIANLWGSDAALYHRRGWSHGVLALVAMPLLLASVDRRLDPARRLVERVDTEFGCASPAVKLVWIPALAMLVALCWRTPLRWLRADACPRKHGNAGRLCVRGIRDGRAGRVQRC